VLAVPLPFSKWQFLAHGPLLLRPAVLCASHVLTDVSGAICAAQIRHLEHFPTYSQTEKKKVVYPRYGDMHIVADTTVIVCWRAAGARVARVS
jgi:hypothetical protein